MFSLIHTAQAASAVFFSVLVTAQNNIASTTCEAGGTNKEPQSNKHVNGTASVSFESPIQAAEPQQPWYFSTTFKDTRSKSLSSKVHTLATFISVPDTYRENYGNKTLQFCQYHASALNVSISRTTDDESSTCDGIISHECRRELQTLLNPRPYLDRCRTLGPVTDTIEKLCGIRLSDPSSIELTPENDCDVDEAPDIDTPDSHRTFAVSRRHLTPVDTRADQFDHYDLYIRQTTPFVLSSRWSQVGDDDDANDQGVTFACLAPSNVTNGSRVPAGDAFPAAESMGVALGAAWLSKAAYSTTTALSMLLLLV